MYSRGGNSYGQQSYSGQSAYNQSLGSNYNSAGGTDSSARHIAMLGASQDAEIGGYSIQSSSGASNYGGQYNSVYGSAGLSSSQQATPMSFKGHGPASLEGRSSYASSRQESPPKYTPAEYGSSARGYGHKVDPLYSEKIPGYSSIDGRQYGEQRSAYVGRDLRSEPSGRYADSVGYDNQRQVEPHDRIDQASLLRREQLLKVQSLQSSSIENGARQVDYLASRGATMRHPTHDLLSYSGRSEPDSRNLQWIGSSSFGSQQTPSILGAAPRRVGDDIVFAQGSSNPGYGVSLPPGRDYGTAKGLLSSSLELDYPGSVMPHGSRSRFDEHKDDQAKYARQLESREEDRRRERLRDRDREREREKERERERERERDRERLRALERREKERERERKLAVEVKRDRTPIRLSRDRRGPSLTIDARPSRKASPRLEISHRRHSPIKEKRREYVCKVHSYRVVDTERDYLSLDKRYPKLFVPPEFSKLVVCWPQEDLKLSLHTAVSFEHDFADEENANLLETPRDQTASGHGEVKSRDTVWNAKVILMSGLSRSALEDLVSESDDRIVHICNILRFCILKKDRAFTAIGGAWDVVDGGNPSNDDSSLVQTALRHVRETAQLDLQKCQHWNRFLEIHYDRIGKDGLFSHKEITVLYVPNLSECLPSFDAWKNQWLEHRSAVAERERQRDLKKEKSKSKEEPRVEKTSNKSAKKEEKKCDSDKTVSKGVDVNKEEKLAAKVKKKENDSNSKEDKPKEITSEQTNSDSKDLKVETSAVTVSGTKTVKKKVIKKVVKKVADKRASSVEIAEVSKEEENKDVDDSQVDSAKPVIGSPTSESPANPSSTKTILRKKVVKKIPVTKKNMNTTDDLSVEVNSGNDPADPVTNSENSPIKTEETAAEEGKEPVAKPAGTKTTTIKRKVIKKVPKKKIADVEAADGARNTKSDVKDEMVDAESNNDNQATDARNSEKQDSPVKQSTTSVASKTSTVSEKSENSSKVGSGTSECKAKSLKEDKNNVGKYDLKSQSKELIDKRKQEEPPRPGFILKTKSTKDTKARSLSLSLESLLDYTDKDADESTFEISVFAESIYEMLQYQMASRILNFLQKLRIKFVSKRNQKKREREESGMKEKETTPSKRLKADDSKVKESLEKSIKVEQDDIDIKSSVKTGGVEEVSPAAVAMEEVPFADVAVGEVPTADISQEEVPLPDVAEEDVPSADDGTLIMEEEEDKLDLEAAESDEDPEEDPDEEDEEMKDATPPKLADEEKNKLNTEMADLPTKEVKEKGNTERSGKDTSDRTSTENAEARRDKKAKAENNKNGSTSAKQVVNTELLQAFRFFDRNRVGYIRVEDMRLIIHTLGHYLSHRDVKELVQSALLETNTGRDDHILYNKLVRMSDI